MRKCILETGVLQKLILSGASLALFFSLYHVRSLEIMGCRSIQCLFVLSYGDLKIEAIKYVIPVIFWIAPQVVLIYVLGDNVASDLGRNSAYIFTRTDRRKQWLLAKMFNLFLYIFIYFAVQFVIVGLVGILSNLETENLIQGLTMILGEFILVLLLNYFIVLIINILSLKISVIYSSAIVLAGNLGTIFASAFLYEYSRKQVEIIKMMPFTQGIFLWHSDVSWFVRRMSGFVPHFSDYGIIFSMGYLLFLCVVSIIWGIYQIQRMDIM